MLSSRPFFVFLALSFVGVIPGCDSSTEAANPVQQLDASSGQADSLTQPDTAAPADLPMATLSGVVTRTAAIQEDGVGDLYVALFDGNPVSLDDAPEPTLIARVLLPEQDLNPEDSEASYLLEEIPPRSEPYFVITFFDDNGTIDVDAPGPDKGDLVSLDGLSAFEVLIDSATDYEHDLVLNVVMPL